MIQAVDKRDASQFATILFEYDSISKLDAWKTSILLEIKNTISPPEQTKEKEQLMGGKKEDRPTTQEGFA